MVRWCRRACLVGAMIAALTEALVAKAFADETAVQRAQNGHLVAMPDIAGLDCAAMAQTIAGLDASGYRGDSEDLGPDHPDHAIFQYENALTAAEYFQCTLGRSRSADPDLAFRLK